MQVLTGIVLLVHFCLAGIIGVRLLRIQDRESLSPERCLGWFFLIGIVLGGVLVVTAYAIWSSAGNAESSSTINQIHAASQFALGIGYAMVLLFTQRTFYPDAKWALVLCWTTIGVMVVSLAGRILYEGFGISLNPGPFHWANYYCRMLGLVWAGTAALGYWIQMRRRSALGLADPLIANRFLLWVLWAAGSVLTAFAEPLARLAYGWLTGADASEATSIQQVGGSLITITLCITSVLTLATTTILFLAFFPTQAYRNWIVARAETQRA